MRLPSKQVKSIIGKLLVKTKKATLQLQKFSNSESTKLTLKAFAVKGQLEAGLDEAGRGCLAGPVTAAAVILPEGFYHPLLNDSKQLSEKEREVL